MLQACLIVYAVVMTALAIVFCLRSLRMEQLRLKAVEAVEFWRGELERLQNQAPTGQSMEVERLQQQKKMLIALVKKWCPTRFVGGLVAFPMYLYPEVIASESSMHSLQCRVAGVNATALATRKNKGAEIRVADQEPTSSPVKEQPPMPDDGI